MVKDVKETMDIQTEILDTFDALDALLSDFASADGIHDFERDTVVSVQNIARELHEMIYSLGFLVEVKDDLNRYEEAK